MPAGRARGRTHTLIGGLAVLATGLVGLVVAPAAHAAPGAVLDLPGCSDNVLARNDDLSTGVVDLPFELNFYGEG